MDAHPLVSILTPSFNQGRFIGDCLRSVARQTYRPIEHVVVDGGSTDESLSVLSASASVSGPELVWSSGADFGQADALNRAFALSRGEIIGWLNSDDAYADARAVGTAVEAFRADPRTGVVFGNALLVNEANQVLQAHPAVPFVEAAYRRMHYLIQPAVFFRRTVLEGEPYFVDERLRYVIDRELFLRLASRRIRFRRIGCVTAVDRHQRHRKVLEPSFADEVRSFDDNVGIRHSPLGATAGRLLRVVVRLSGTPLALSLPHRIDPAIELEIPPLLRRLRLQVLTRRRDMTFS